MRRLLAAATVMALAIGAPIALGPAAGGARAFTVVASPNPRASTGSHLNGVWCVTAIKCTAVGYYATASTPGRVLVERWNGTKWSIVTAPVPTGSTGSYLNGVACVTGAKCTAVGYYTTASSTGRTLVERWNGTKWAIVSSPNATGALGSYLNAVSCTAASSCAAVGYSYSSNATHTLAERWNGTKWAVVASPNPSGDEADLTSVSCTSGSNCLAVGYYTSTKFVDTPLAERWNGTKWAIVAAPNPKGSDSYLNAVSCASATYCGAVGSTYPSTGPGKTLVERWNGSGWAIVASPNPSGAGDSYLSGVRCKRRDRLHGGRRVLVDVGQNAGRAVERHRVEGPREPEPDRVDRQLSQWCVVRERNGLHGGRRLARFDGTVPDADRALDLTPRQPPVARRCAQRPGHRPSSRSACAVRHDRPARQRRQHRPDRAERRNRHD